jgi:hypothetical protein
VPIHDVPSGASENVISAENAQSRSLVTDNRSRRVLNEYFSGIAREQIPEGSDILGIVDLLVWIRFVNEQKSLFGDSSDHHWNFVEAA